MKRFDSQGAEMIPIRLLISCSIISVIVLLVGYGISTVSISTSEHQIEEECQMLQALLSTMIESGVPRDIELSTAIDGTKRIYTFSLPNSLMYVSFGGDPDENNDGVLIPQLMEQGNAIVFKVQGGSKHILWLPHEKYRFREGTYIDSRWTIKIPEQSFIIRTGGRTTLVFEEVHYHQNTNILIHACDDIEMEKR